MFAPEPPGPCPLANSPARFTLKSVTFTGQSVLKANELAPSYAETIGKEVPVSAICEVRDRASRLLFDHGVLARVKIPPQTIADGTLTLEVLAAHVVNVRVRGDAGHAQAAVERYLGKLRGMNPFNMKVAERYLLLANDVPGVRVRAALRPSTNGEAGAVDLGVTVSVKTVDAVVNVQNVESDTIGPWGGLARIDLQDLTDFGERTSIVGYHTLNSEEQWVGRRRADRAAGRRRGPGRPGAGRDLRRRPWTDRVALERVERRQGAVDDRPVPFRRAKPGRGPAAGAGADAEGRQVFASLLLGALHSGGRRSPSDRPAGAGDGWPQPGPGLIQNEVRSPARAEPRRRSDCETFEGHGWRSQQPSGE